MSLEDPSTLRTCLFFDSVLLARTVNIQLFLVTWGRSTSLSSREEGAGRGGEDDKYFRKIENAVCGAKKTYLGYKSTDLCKEVIEDGVEEENWC